MGMVEQQPAAGASDGQSPKKADIQFERLQCEVVERDMSNRKEGWEVKRRFVQGVWRRTQ